MPPRLNKRQLRELEELQSLETTPGVEAEEDVAEEEPSPPSKKVTGGFAALMATDDGDEKESEEEEVSRASKSKKKKKKKKASSATSNAVVSAPPPPIEEAKPTSASTEQNAPAGLSKKEKKAIKKQKAKAAKDEGDELDRALAELSLKHPELKQVAQHAPATKASSKFYSLLAVSLSHLDAEAEMRKFFGSKVVTASKASGSGSSNAPARRQPTAMRSNLTRPQSTWWPSSYRQGLSSRMLTEEELAERKARHQWNEDVPGERVWTVEYTRKYRGMTKTFIQMVMSGDPEGLFHILRSFPYHADTLLQLSEVYFHREEHSTASDFIDRALFTYERAFVGAFNFTSGQSRLDFDRVENRPFFLAVHRQASDLQRRGCVRTAFEFARLLLALDPATDPHGALLHLDFLAIKSGMHQWLIDMWDTQCQMSASEWQGRAHVRALPGWAYARALALFVAEEESKDEEHKHSTEALLEAVNAFPSVVPLLADKADITLPGTIRAHAAFRIHTDASTLSNHSHAILHLLSHLYALRSAPLWKVKSRAAWFARTIGSLEGKLTSITFGTSSKTTSPSPSLFHSLYSRADLAYSVYRHVVVLEPVTRAGRLFGFLPPQILTAKQLACDPVPPPTRASEYDGAFFAGAEDPLAATAPRGRREAARLLERMVPDPVFRRQLEDFFRAHPGFAARFPGGVLEFAQAAAQMPEEVLEDLMIEVANAEQGGVAFGEGAEGVMPGQMPGLELVDDDLPDFQPAPGQDPTAAAEEFEEEEEEEEEAEEEVETAPLPVRLLRNVMNRFWGGGRNDEDSSDDELRDEAGVD
ncbi:transcriptional repressor TCF25-domain-containing protein [Phanerochaete sordida]|uniref:Transcriptional repressor TCF25-domain-containing protein n=1 Tax=Phanerochaete sordida TaxID=48140 RepID=A0A9P3GSA5_9APHY|nr:transcriptional repressor TCF25-domain-containing protein [Phanerochaete sordida]